MPTLAELSMASQYGGKDFQNQDWASIYKALQNFSPDQYDGQQGLKAPPGMDWYMDNYQPGGGMVQLQRRATNQDGVTGDQGRYDTVTYDPTKNSVGQEWQQMNSEKDNWMDYLTPFLALTGAGMALGPMLGGDAAASAGADAAGSSAWTSGYDLAGGGALDGSTALGSTGLGTTAATTGGYTIPTADELAAGGFGTGGTGLTGADGIGAATSVTGAGAGAAGYGTATGTGVLGSLSNGLSNLGVNGSTLGTLGNLASTALGYHAANSAGQTQADAANNATALQKYIYDQTSQNVAPWLNAGKTSLSSLMTGMGNGQFTPQSYTGAGPMSTVGAAPSFQTVANAPKLNSYGPQDAMSKFGSVGSMKAFSDYTAKNPYVGPGAWTADKFKEDPGYQFQLQQGLDALTNKSSLAGGMNSNNMKGLIGYAQGLANTDYQQAFGNYQTEANRGLGEYQTGLQDYMQQFQLGQDVTSRNNQLTQQQFQDATQTTANNNQATQTDNQNRIQVTGLNNQNITQDLTNAMNSAGFNNQWSQTGFEDTLQGDAFNNSVAQQLFGDKNTTTGLNNQNQQTQFNNLAQLSQMGLGAGLQQGQLGAQYASNAGNNMMSGAAATAAGTVGGANAIAGGINNAYEAWLMQQMMSGGFGNFTTG